MKLNRTMLAIALIMISAGCGGKTKQTDLESTDDRIRYDSPSRVTEDEKKQNTSGFYNGNNRNEEQVMIGATSNAMTDSTSVSLKNGVNSKYNPMSSSSATMGNNGIRKFIKTADLKFRVRSVIRATYDIEDITHQFGGFVAHTGLESRIDNTNTTAVSRDSSLETTYYTVVNSMTLRIPEAKMDSALRAMTPLVDYMDHRIIDINDVHIQLIANELAQSRLRNYQGRMRNNVDTKGRDLEDMNTSEENILQRQEESDNTLINNLTIQDQIEFSTVTLYIYQRQAIKRELIWNAKNIDAYEPGFGYKIKRSLISGWRGLEAVVLFALRFWVVYLVGLAGFLVWRWWSKR
jgi:hypothetical protein